MNQEFSEIVAACSSTESLPELPESAFKLLRELNAPNPSRQVIERLISSDPGMTANILRTANSAIYGLGENRATTISAALNVMGDNSIKQLATSMLVSSSFSRLSTDSGFDPKRFAAHGAFTALLAKHIHSTALRYLKKSSEHTSDEVFSAAILHELGLGLVAYVNPTLSAALHFDAKKRSGFVADVFKELYGEPIEALAVAACRAWNLPDTLSTLLIGWHQGASHSSDPIAMASISIANWMAEENGCGIHAWTAEIQVPSAEFESCGVCPGDLAELIPLASSYANGLGSSRAA